MKVPSFKTKKIRSDILKLVDLAPTRSMYDIVLKSIDYAMDELSSIRDLIISDNPDIKKALKAWDDAFEKFGEREAYYYQAFLESEDRSVVDAPLFNGKYGNWDFDPIPKWPDIETPWRLANDLSTIAATAGFNQKFLNDLERRFKDIISDFWLKANSLIVEQKAIYEQKVADESIGKHDENGRVFGFWPIVAIGAAALVGALGVAAGYTASQSGIPEDYVKLSPLEEHVKTAKTVGIGMLIGAAIAVVLMLRIRR